MATDYSKFTQADYDNQKLYLNNIIAANGGHDIWAESEMEKLNSQYKPTTQPTQTSTPSTGNSGNSGNSGYKSTGNVNNGDNKYGTTERYTNGEKHISTDGGKTFTNQATGETYEEKQTESKYGLTEGWNSYTGATGKQFEVDGLTGTIIVTRPDGSYSRVLPTDANYAVTLDAMQKDLAGNGINYTPSKTWDGTRDVYKMDGSGEVDHTEDYAYTVKDYLAGNKALHDDFVQWGQTNAGKSLDDFITSIYNGVGSNGVTLQDAIDRLTGYGLTDYLPDNAILSASGKLIPKNEFVDFTEGPVSGSGGNLDFSNGQFANYGGQQYLIGGDVANFLNYVNGKTGNTTNLDYIFDDMANNPYANKDAEFAQMYQDALNQFNSSANIQTPTTGTGGSYTGYANVDRFIDYANSLEGYNQATGGTGSSNIWNEIQAMLQGGLESQQAFLDNQRTQAEQNAENLMRQAYVIGKLQGDSVKEAMSAAGLGTSGAMQSAQLGVQNNYNSNVADIRSNLQQMISNFDEQELQALIDHTNSLTKYKYQIDNDEHDRAMQNAQLYMQQMEMLQAQQQQDWENAYRQQLMELENQQYADSQAQSQSDTDYERKQNEAAYYAQLVNAGAITAQQYQQFLAQLGLI